VHLEDEPDVAPHLDEIARREARQIAAEHLDPALMD